MPSIRPIAPTLLLARRPRRRRRARPDDGARRSDRHARAQLRKARRPPGTGSSEIGKSAAEQRRTKWQTGMKTYMECLKQFVTEQQAASSTHAKAANAAVEEYNRAIKIYNDAIQAAPQ